MPLESGMYACQPPLVRKLKYPSKDEDHEINKAAKGQHKIIAFMDDIKCHAPTSFAIRAFTKKIEECSQQIGLLLNLDKFVHYSKENQDGDHIDNIATITNGYKYLVILQQERDTLENFTLIEGKITQKVEEVLESKLTTAQKRQL